MRQRVQAALAPPLSKRSSTQRVLWASALSKSRRVAVRLKLFLVGAITHKAKAEGSFSACSVAQSASACVCVRTRTKRSGVKPNCASPSTFGSPSSARFTSGMAQTIGPSALAAAAQAKAKPKAAGLSPGAAGRISVSGAFEEVVPSPLKAQLEGLVRPTFCVAFRIGNN